MVKLAISPFRFLANALGMNADKMESIPIEPLQKDFTAEQYRQLNDIATISKNKPDMVVNLTQYLNWSNALSIYSVYKAKEAYLISLKSGENEQKIHSQEIENLDDNDKNFIGYLDTLIKAKGISATGTSVQDKVNVLYST